MYEIGDQFLTGDQQKRIKREEIYTQVYSNERSLYEHEVEDILGNKKKVPMPPIIPIGPLVSDVTSDLLFGEFPGFDFQNETQNNAVKDFLNKTRFRADLIEASSLLSATGTLFWHIFLEENLLRWEFINPKKAIWEDRDEILKWIKFFELLERDKSKRWEKWQINEHALDETGQYVILDYVITVDIIHNRKITAISAVEKTRSGLDFIPIVKMVNLGQYPKDTGRSDYKGKLKLFEDIDRRVVQINEVLNDHANPWVFLPHGILDAKGRVHKKQGRLIQKGPSANGSENSVDFYAWDAKLESSFKSIDTMIRMVLFTSRISSSIAGFTDERSGNIESGRALKWRSVNTTSMIQRKRIYWTFSINSFFDMANKMVSDLQVDPSQLHIEWYDGLPMDDEAFVQSITQQVNTKILSKLTAIQKVNEMSQADAQVELDQINEEDRQEQANQAQAFGGQL
jgi:hypothetical protein